MIIRKSTMDAETLMQNAIETARKGIAKGQTPFGCAIYIDGEIIAEHNCVHASTDITAHAEITALRSACKKTGKIDLSGAMVASTCEPCPMCAAALHWAKVSTIFYGASIGDANKAGFNELGLAASEVFTKSNNRVSLIGGVLEEECKALFEHWLKQPLHKEY
ncbi:MAG: nucleoside deaminase [Pseudomonadales bacterium]|nr:nucleoside deaminase [Pseudomonadales bacterium]